MNVFQNIRNELKKNIVGMDGVIRDLFMCLISNEHILIEGLPGLAKTTMAKSFAKCINLKFSRIQGTPDLIPSDLTGGDIYKLQSGTFEFMEGPLFANLVLVDEINRMSPKTQSALLESMEENSITVGKKTYNLPKPFIVIATQNPVEFEGTYSLPVAQLDRFMMKLSLDYLDEEDELNVLKLKTMEIEEEVKPIVNKEILNSICDEVKKIHVSLPILTYIRDIVVATRKDDRITLGASTRAGVHLLKVARAHAYLDGRTYVIPDDVKNNVLKVLSHRLVVDYEEESSTEEILKDIVNNVEVPKGDFR
ncbi:MAG: MoxR-like ATPase [Methanothermococcus sp.]|uniref:AAA family ATPase n=1 Tax=Methanothermococcus TaxID=155862 RepID=UPI0003764450|nr:MULTISPECIES: MoxR family ATPase [Methanothermococcus]MDK2789557.1 MoxR-like ATPase [Methanothermococcus sp.]